MAYMEKYSYIFRTRGYKVLECATNYAGVISVTDFAQKQRHLVVFLVCDMKVTQNLKFFTSPDNFAK